MGRWRGLGDQRVWKNAIDSEKSSLAWPVQLSKNADPLRDKVNTPSQFDRENL